MTRKHGANREAKPEGESLLGRWARRKQAAQAEDQHKEAVEAEAEAEDPMADETAERTDEADILSTLPDIDSLGAGSDYKPFLNRAVPAELRRKALRKAWATDPGVRAYKTFAEYDWDFNAPGYGALRAGDTAGKLLGRLFSKAREEGEAATGRLAREALNEPDDTPNQAESKRLPAANNQASPLDPPPAAETAPQPQQAEEPETDEPRKPKPAPRPRRHGAAFPKP